ncbi:MAG: D-alanyl-D-alanine carboxypeptidase [Desulfotalea sp.]
MNIIKIIQHLSLGLFLLSPSYAFSDNLDKLITKGGYIFLYEKDGEPAAEMLLPKKQFIPASTAKIITAMIALDHLGEDYRFKTDFYYSDQKDLIIIGHGDPLLVSEEIVKIAEHLKEIGITQINNVLIGGSSYGPPPGIEDALDPYEAKSASLAVNFNSVSIKIKNGVVTSDEPQTPTLPLVAHFSNHPDGKYRFNINAIETRLPPESAYAGQLFHALLSKNDIIVQGVVEVYSPSEHGDLMEPTFVWESSFTLKQILKSCLRYSNNFMANQLFLSLSEKTDTKAWTEARQVTANFLKEKIGLSKDEVLIMDGAGLSRKNRITPIAMIKILDKFSEHYKLLKRGKKTGTYLKTGTMDGIYCLAGYSMQNATPQPFAIFLDQNKNNRSKVLVELLKYADTAPNKPKT